MKTMIMAACAAVALACVAAPAVASPQDDAAMRSYILTVDKMHRVFALMNQMKSNPKLVQSWQAVDANDSLSEAVAKIRRSPAEVSAIHKAGLTETDMVLFMPVLFAAGVGAELPPAKRGSLGVAPSNIAFVQQHKAEIEAFTKSLQH